MTDDESDRSPSLGNNMSEPVLDIETEDDSSETDQENELEDGSHTVPSTSVRTRSVHNFMVFHINHVIFEI